eukprot:TRINITY_DN6267_c0_g1_i1.p1 TRINITY_DN6267_c0_g1~~TRINITY_DN6267_c0_g1_i1.p1  ORF type:complete len:362 (+),score=75.31 TRINITY_DN6267_c0_g1_i1:152-1237(+)
MLVEYRIPVPFTLEEFRVGHRYMTLKATNQEFNPPTSDEGGILAIDADDLSQESKGFIDGGAVRVVAHHPFTDHPTLGSGEFTHRVFEVASRWPLWIQRALKGSKSLVVEEKTWHAYPRIRTEYSCSLLGPRVKVEVNTIHVENDDGNSHNVHNLSYAQREKLRVVPLDIARDAPDPKYYSGGNSMHVASFKSDVTDRGPLRNGWQASTTPMMCAYKLVNAKVNIWGIQTRAETMICEALQSVYLGAHQQAFLWMDEWISLSLLEMNSKIAQNPILSQVVPTTGNFPVSHSEPGSNTTTAAAATTTLPATAAHTQALRAARLSARRKRMKGGGHNKPKEDGGSGGGGGGNDSGDGQIRARL